MDNKTKRKLIDVGIVIMIIMVIGFLISTYQFMKSEGKQCLADPLGYFELKNNGATCNCWKDGISYRDNYLNTGNLLHVPQT